MVFRENELDKEFVRLDGETAASRLTATVQTPYVCARSSRPGGYRK
jgi:hypothetical protein